MRLEARLQLISIILFTIASHKIVLSLKTTLRVEVEIHFVPEEAEKFLLFYTFNDSDIEVFVNFGGISLTPNICV